MVGVKAAVAVSLTAGDGQGLSMAGSLLSAGGALFSVE